MPSCCSGTQSLLWTAASSIQWQPCQQNQQAAVECDIGLHLCRLLEPSSRCSSGQPRQGGGCSDGQQNLDLPKYLNDSREAGTSWTPMYAPHKAGASSRGLPPASFCFLLLAEASPQLPPASPSFLQRTQGCGAGRRDVGPEAGMWGRRQGWGGRRQGWGAGGRDGGPEGPASIPYHPQNVCLRVYKIFQSKWSNKKTL